jgi:hypothetical protein
LCNGKTMDTDEPINHTKLLRKWGYKFKHFILNTFLPAPVSCVYGRRSALGTSEGLPDVRSSGDPIGWAPRADSRPLSSSVAICISAGGPGPSTRLSQLALLFISYMSSEMRRS